MNYFITILFALFFCKSLYAQQDLDSSTYHRVDTLFALDLMEEASYLIKDYKLDSALIKASKAYNIFVMATGDSSILAAKGLEMIGRVHYYKRDYDKSQKAWSRSLSLLEKKLGNKHVDVGKALASVGMLHYQRREYDTAITLYHQALEIAKNAGAKKSIASALSKIAFVYWNQGKYPQALTYFEETYAIEKIVHGEFSQNVAYTLNNLGAVHSNQGNYYNSLSYFQKSLKIRVDTLGTAHPNVYKSYANIGMIYNQLSQFHKSEQYLLKAIKGLTPILGENAHEVNQIHVNLGYLYHKTENHKKSLHHYKKRLEYDVSIYGDKGMLIAENCYWIAKAYYEVDSLEKAKKYISKSNNTPLIEGNREEDEITGLCYQLLAQIYKDDNKKKEALSYAKKAYDNCKNFLGDSHPLSIELLLNQGELENHFGNYISAKKCFTSVLDKLEYKNAGDLVSEDRIIILLNALKTIGASFLKEYEENTKISVLEAAHSYLSQAVKVLEYQSHFLTVEDRSKLLKNTRNIYAHAIRTNFLLFEKTKNYLYANEAFRLSELGEAFLLYTNMLNRKLLKESSYPDSLKTKSKVYEKMISDISQNIYQLHSQETELLDTTILRLQAKVFDLNQDYKNWKETLISEHGNHYSIAETFNVVNVENVQNNLNSGSESFLKYFIGNDFLTIFVINQDRYDLYQLALHDDLYMLVEDLRKSCNKENFDISPENYLTTATKLYDRLIRPVDAILKNKLTIVPSGYIGYIPFEALLIEMPLKYNRWGDYQYLIRDKQISYGYSATMLYQQNEESQKNTGSSFAGFAPYSEANTQLTYNVTRDYLDTKVLALQGLPHSGDEVSAISNIFNGTGYTGKEATSQRFLSSLDNNHSIIHIASHAKSNFDRGEFSFIAFPSEQTDSSLKAVYADDIINQDISAELIVLSACETGVGELKTGEGIISLARAFIQSGAYSVVTSQWEVADESTKTIMIEFYKQLIKGVDKQTALHNAKLTFIDSVDRKNISLAHPFYWSPFVLIGNTRAITQD